MSEPKTDPTQLDFNDLKLTARARNALGWLLSRPEFGSGNYDDATGTMYGGFHLRGIADTLNEAAKPIHKYRGIGKKSAEEIKSAFQKHGLELTDRCPTCGKQI